jgi:hypothetical protein
VFTQSSTITGTAGTCSTNTKFTNMLKKMNTSVTVVLDTVDTTTTWTTCKEVWMVSGSCCSTTGLNSVFDGKMKNSFKMGFDNFMGGLKNVGEALSKLQQLLSNPDNVKTRLTTAYSANSTQFNSLTVDQALQMLGAAKTFKDDVEKFKTDGKTCFTATSEAVGKLMCYGCAAKTSTDSGLEQSDGSTGMTQDSCNTLLGKCHSTWHFMHKIGNMMLVVSIINRSLKPADAPPPKPTEKPAFGGLMMSDIIEAYKNCNSSITDSTCTDAHKTTLCKSNFNVMAPPKKCNADNMSASNTAQLPPSGTTLPASRILLDASASGRRTLQTTEATGDVAVSSSGADLTKSITTPTTSASVDTASTDSGTKNSNVFFAGVIAVLASLAMLN